MRHSSKPWAFDANDSEEDLAKCIFETLLDVNVEPKALNHAPLWASSRMQMISAGTAKNDSEIGTSVLDFLDDELNVIAEWLYDRGVVYRPAWPLMGEAHCTVDTGLKPTCTVKAATGFCGQTETSIHCFSVTALTHSGLTMPWR